jgi:glycosyltransferase involved in cell wall biosynthesis
VHKTTILKVLQLTKKYPWPATDGEIQAILCNLRGLIHAGCEPEVLSLNTLKHYASEETQRECMRELGLPVHAVELDTRPGFGGFVRSVFSPLPYHVHRFYSRAFAEKLDLLLSRGNFDVVLLEGVYLMAYLPVLRRHKLKIALRLHNAEHEIWARLASKSQSLIKRTAYRYLSYSVRKFEEKHLSLADLLLPITERDAAWAASHAAGVPIRTIPACIKISGIPELSTGKKIYFIGSMDWFPNREAWVWLLRQVWPKVRLKVPDAELHLAGRNFPADTEGKGEESVILHGEVTEAQAFVGSCDVLAVPLFSGSGMRLKILEALAMGKPVVSTFLGAEGIASESGAAIHLADDAESFAAALIEILQSIELRKQALTAGWNLLHSEFGEEVIGKKLIDALLWNGKA